MSGGQRDVYGLVRSSEAEHREFEESIDAKRTTEIPSILQMRCEYSGNDLIYLGFAEKGLGISASGWLLHKYTYDASGKVTVRQVSFDSWDDRVLTTYS